jgi:glycosyltransferase involved in cell wall biosynthesis
MNDVAVSIVIPCFNLGEFLGDAVASAQAQTRPAAEIIVVDDGSTDEHTLRVLHGLEQSGVTVLHTPNRGAPAARNYGIAHARGEYLLCLDADDLLEPAYLAATVPVLDAQAEVGIVAPGVEMFGDVDGLWTPPDYDPVTLLYRNCIPSAALFRRVCWQDAGGYPDLKGGQDWAFWIAIVTGGWRWSVVPQVLYRYRRRAGSISEFREANRQASYRALIELHADVYRECVADICVHMDAELTALRHQLGRFRRDANARAQKIVALEGALRRANVKLPGATRAATTDDTPQIAKRRRVLDRAVLRMDRIQNDLQRLEGAERLRRLVRETVPADAHVLVVSRGDDELLKLETRTAWHFPRLPDGRYAGHHPASSEAAIAHIDELRAQGADYVVFPATAEWWLEHYAGLRKYLDVYGKRVAARADAGIIYSLQATHHTFSVVICTHNRSALLELALNSLFAQEYPPEAYEILVVDNASTDDTGEVVRRAARHSPVPLSYHREPRNGLSYARNLGSAEARNEFVAFLDDDATAVPGWLSAFNTVITREHALVVGGRVELRFEDGFTPPTWFEFPYVRGFFGINYRTRGRTQEVFRIRTPDYIGGGNSAYARRLFTHFGGYDPQLGRNHKTLLAAEETYLNRVLERHDIPIYYTDAAVIHHFIDGQRLTRRHILRKAYWSGISNAILGTLLEDPAAPARRSRWHELRGLVATLLRSPKRHERFGRSCRGLYNLSFLAKSYAVEFEQRVLGRSYTTTRAITWSTANWVAEIERWPDSPEKSRQLYHLHMALGNADAAQAELVRLAEHTPSGDQQATRELDALWGPLRRLRYEQMIEQFRALIDSTLPAHARVLVVSRGDTELLQLGARAGRHFPCLSDGTYAGHYPADSTSAIEQLERLRKDGAEYLVFPATSAWWLEHYPGLRAHLEHHYERIALSADVCIAYALLHKRTADRVVSVSSLSMAQPAARQASTEIVM